eukprot:CAMPEP_0170094506 /NCGR_PEP_ID=MMETSP0019_2-20121128/27287_1 /TAXON_ID=98059 /ORGANISM="Dinobryon sp., Strain UTEXLB2267" /LENGTH=31 /DNA_ID= /DNA_START= /DNA_END= /DNA_ORIENTATION=
MAACYEVVGDIDSARIMYEESLKLRQVCLAS